MRRFVVTLMLIATTCAGSDAPGAGTGHAKGPVAAKGGAGGAESAPGACTGITPSGAQVLCVDAGAAAGGTGTAAAPLRTVTAALAAARDSTEVLVAAADYREDLVIKGRTVRLYGGFAAGGDFRTRAPSANPTTLRGTGATSVLTLTRAGTSVIDGFRITGGTGHFDGYHLLGGGLWIDGGQVTISHCSIEGNSAERSDPYACGGGLAVKGTVTITDNIVRGNRSARGAGICVTGTARITRNRIEDNIGSGDHGGGLFLIGPSLLLEDNRIAGNETGRGLHYGWGGGVIFAGKGTIGTLRRNTWTRNYAPSHGSAIFFDNGAEGTVEHELVFKNKCSQSGSALYVDSLDDSGNNGSHVVFTSITVADHRCTLGKGHGLYVEGRASTGTVEDSIFWNNGDEVYSDGKGTATFKRTLSEVRLPGSDNAVIAGPGFVDPKGGDYHLAAGSAAAGHGAFPGPLGRR